MIALKCHFAPYPRRRRWTKGSPTCVCGRVNGSPKPRAPPPYDPWLIAQALGIRCIEVLERLCDAAALEMMIPEDHFRADLARDGFGGDRVVELCRRYRAGIEAVALRMVDSVDAPACAGALVEHVRPSRWRRRQQVGGAPDFAISYAAYSARCRQQGWFLARQLALPKTSCLRSAARSGKVATGREPLALLGGDVHTFRIEALPLADRPRRRGRSAVLAFFIQSN